MFTKGPWIAGKEIQLDDDGIQTVPIFGPEGPGWGRVGTAYAEIGRDDELWPNARLQAAAPELLNACELARNMIGKLTLVGNGDFGVMTALDKAIAKVDD
jgi:hypothetical protein